MASISIAATDGSGSFSAFVAEPASKPAGAVVLIQEIFGINESLRATAAAIADLGFWAIAPDLFWRIEPGVELDAAKPEEFAQALSLMGKFSADLGIADLKATLAAARALPGGNGKAGTLGFCLGGMLAVRMAIESDADVNVSYYGVGLDGLIGELPAVKTPLVAHVAGKDAFFPAEKRAAFLAAAADFPLVTAYNYDNSDHGFARAGGGPHWDGLAAVIANGRSAEALAAALA
jgi:carboxymethylenebutenolidase